MKYITRIIVTFENIHGISREHTDPIKLNLNVQNLNHMPDN